MTARGRAALRSVARQHLATLPTALEPGGALPSGARLFVKRDDLTGLGMGGNKARKLEYLCGDAIARGADVLITTGAAQSNHARMTAAAGTAVGLDVHLVLGGREPPEPRGNQLLSRLFGAKLHFTGAEDWDELDAAAGELAARLRGAGRRPYLMPVGGSTPVGALGFAEGYLELMEQCTERGVSPQCIVFASSTGGTHAGLLAGRALAEDECAPHLLAIGVAKTGGDLSRDAATLASEALELIGAEVPIDLGTGVEVDQRFQGAGYAVPTAEGDAAIFWAAHRRGWVLDRVYSGKAFSGLLGLDDEGRFESGGDVVFWHTGGIPAVFGPDGSPIGG